MADDLAFLSNERKPFVPRVLLFGIIVILFLVQLPLPLNHDASWHFHTAFRFLEGDIIGVDIFDINPPMSMWLFSIPAMIVNLFDTNPAITFKLYFVGVSISMMYLCRHVMKKSGWSAGNILWFLVAVSAALFLLPGYDFAQREQFVSILTLPYVMAAFLRRKDLAAGYSFWILAGISAGLGIGIKPYFLLLPVFVEAWLMFKTRTISSVLHILPATIFVTLLIYVIMVYLFAPLYYSEVVPNALYNYSGYALSGTSFILGAFKYIFFPAILLLFCAVLKAHKATHLSSMLVASCAFFIAAVLQQKNWSYQYYPAVFYLYLCVAVSLIAIGNRMGNRSLIFPIIIGLWAIGVLHPTTRFLQDGYRAGGTGERVAKLEQLIREHGVPNKSVYAFITSPRDVHPAVLNARARWSGNAGAQVFLPALLALDGDSHADNAAKIKQIAAAHDRATIQQLTDEKPSVLIFDEAKYRLAIRDSDFDYIDYYTQYPQFAALMTGYYLTERVGNFAVYVRKDPAR